GFEIHPVPRRSSQGIGGWGWGWGWGHRFAIAIASVLPCDLPWRVPCDLPSLALLLAGPASGRALLSRLGPLRLLNPDVSGRRLIDEVVVDVVAAAPRLWALGAVVPICVPQAGLHQVVDRPRGAVVLANGEHLPLGDRVRESVEVAQPGRDGLGHVAVRQIAVAVGEPDDPQSDAQWCDVGELRVVVE